MLVVTKMVKELLRALMILALLVAGSFIIKKFAFSWNVAPSQVLSHTTQSLLEKLSSPIDVTLFSTDIEHYHQAEFLINKYQAINPNIQLHWQHEPYAHSNDYQGPALKVTMTEQKDIIDLLQSPLNEQTLSQTLFKLRNNANQWIVFLQGHNEPSPFGTRPADYGLLRIALGNQGFKVQTLSLTKTPVIADNTRLLVIASPKESLLPGEEKLIAEYLFQGGSLLWLLDKDMHPQPFLSDLFYVKALPGTIVDYHGHQLGTPHPGITIVDTYPSLPFAGPKSLTAFPFSVALSLNHNTAWNTQPLLLTHKESWTETGELNQDVSGPLTLGVCLTKSIPINCKQRNASLLLAIAVF